MILDVIVEDKLKRLPEHKKRISEEEMTRLAIESQRVSHSFYDALAKGGLSIISEFKKASPSHGNMNNKITLEERIKAQMLFHVLQRKIILREVQNILSR